jgi:hypothetical protein
MQQTIQPLASSFRDPSGFVFQKDGIIYRQVNKTFKEDFDHFTGGGCYDHFIKNEWLIPHEEITENLSGSDNWYKTLRPQKIPFISYPYEWCFDMLKDAALLSLQLAKTGSSFGIIVKDATPFNVQWLKGKPIFIDTLSFERYDPSKSWIAYRQFCESFLSPLLLMYYTQQPMQSLLLAHPEGIPLSIARSLLPWRSKFSFHTYLHIHLHDRLASKTTVKETHQQNNFSEKKLLRLIDSLQSLIQALHWKGNATAWNKYYDEANQRNDYMLQKKKIIAKWISELPGLYTGVDLGANEGQFSSLLAGSDIQTIAADFDHSAINKLYQKTKKENERNILPLVIDLANPSPAGGLNNRERISFIERTNADLGLALALIHHLAIGKNIPFEKVSEFFKNITDYLIIEFVPKRDERVQFMLKQKKDIYQEYTEENFVRTFEKYFFIQKKQEIAESGRALFQMKRRAILP